MLSCQVHAGPKSVIARVVGGFTDELCITAMTTKTSKLVRTHPTTIWMHWFAIL